MLLCEGFVSGCCWLGVPASLVWTLVPDGTAYALLTFARARCVVVFMPLFPELLLHFLYQLACGFRVC